MLKLASGLTFGKDSTDIIEGINYGRMREERAAKAKQVLKQYGIPAILVWDWGLEQCTTITQSSTGNGP